MKAESTETHNSDPDMYRSNSVACMKNHQEMRKNTRHGIEGLRFTNVCPKELSVVTYIGTERIKDKATVCKNLRQTHDRISQPFLCSVLVRSQLVKGKVL